MHSTGIRTQEDCEQLSGLQQPCSKSAPEVPHKCLGLLRHALRCVDDCAALPMSLLLVLPAAGADLYLCNWCSVQRVAYRCKVLSSRRLGLLNSIEFDWTGADPLS